MIPKEKAEELINQFMPLTHEYDYEHGDCYDEDKAKQCALIAVDELIKSTLHSSDFGGHITINATEYWEEVKQEIELL